MDEEDENKLIDDVMSSWSDRPKDYWTVTDKEVIRHHVNPRSSMFSPARTGCPVPVDQLSTARTTILIDKDGRADEQFTPNWKNSLEAHRKTDKVWTGRTVFYHLEGHGEEDVDPRVNDEKLFEHNDPQDALDRETFGQEYACQVQGLQYEEDDDMRWFNDAALFHFADPEDALDREIFGAEYAFQVEGVEHQVDEITAAFFAEMHEQEQSWPHEDEVDQAFREPGTSDDEGEDESQPQESMCALVHEPGYGILDTGCGRGLVGANTLERHIKMLSKHGMNIKELPDKMHTFRYGNGSADKTSRRIELPVFVAGKELRVRLHVVPGDVPLLISKRLLKSVGAMIDLNDNKLIMTKAGVAAAIHEMKDNSYQINLLDIAGGSKVVSPEVDVLGVTSFQEESSHDEADDDVGVCCVFKAKERKEVLGNVTRVLAQNARDAPSLMEGANADGRVRTAGDWQVPPEMALKFLEQGNGRFIRGSPKARAYVEGQRAKNGIESALEGLLEDMSPVATSALKEHMEAVAATAIRVNVFHTIDFLLKYSAPLRERVENGDVEIHGGIYHLDSGKAASALEGLLIGLSGAAQQAEDELGACEPDQLVAHCVRVNVWRSIDFLLKFSAPLRALVRSGNLEIQGGIYHLETGRVEFMGRSPKQAELVASEKTPMPPMLQSLPIRTTRDGPMQPRRALRILKDGNRRFHQGEPLSGNVTGQMRKALAQEGQAPLAAILGCADSRAPLETVFDTMPGDVFVLRNAGNTCTHAEGSVMGSLEFCVGSLDTKLIIVLGHTACGAIKGATKTHFLAKNGQRPQVTRALDALLQSLSAIAAKANDELGHHATEAQDF
eukprot:g3954.t1